jgi:hypothetical protein
MKDESIFLYTEKSGPPSIKLTITNAEVIKVLIAGSIIQAVVSILRILCQCTDKHSLLLRQLREWLRIKIGKVA